MAVLAARRFPRLAGWVRRFCSASELVIRVMMIAALQLVALVFCGAGIAGRARSGPRKMDASVQWC